MNYLVFQNGQQLGPHTWPELQAMLAQGTLAGSDQVRPEAGGEWSTVAALSASFSVPAPAAGATPGFATVPAYAMPGANLNAGPSYKLFDSRAVAIATLFGSPAAGAIVMALNYSRLGQKSKATLAVVYGFLATIAGIALGFVLPQGVGSGLGFGLLLAMMNIAKSAQGPAIAEHQQQGGKLASGWAAFFIGLGLMVVIIGIIAVVVVVMALVKPSG